MMASSHSTSGTTCTSIARQATTGASVIESSILARNDTDTGLPTELPALQTPASKLRQLATSAAQLRDTLDTSSPLSTSPQLQAARDALITGLSGADAAATTLVKQLMRCGRDTPAQRLSLAAVLTYDHFAGAAASFLSSTTSVLARSSQQQANPSRDSADIDTLLARLSSACAEVSSSGGILLDGGLGNATQPLSLLDTDNEATPPVYEIQATSGFSHDHEQQQPPPPFEASTRDMNDSGYEDWDGKKTSSRHVEDKGEAPAYYSGNRSSSRSKLSKTPASQPPAKKGFFADLVDALRPKPEPLVVPLCKAPSRGEMAQMRSLVSQKVNVDGRNEQGSTALICAVLADQAEAVQFLLEAGVDPRACDDVGSGLGSSSRDKYSKLPFYHAVEARNMRVAELLPADKASGGTRLAGQEDDFGESFFARCVLSDNAPPVTPWFEMLLAHDADAATEDLTGRPLVLAVLGDGRQPSRRDNAEAVAGLLVRHGASPSARDGDGTALVHRAVDQGRTKLALQLISLGADANGKDLSGVPVLLAALSKGDREVVRALLERAADPNAKDLYGSRLLAALYKMSSLRADDRDPMATLMLEHGAKK